MKSTKRNPNHHLNQLYWEIVETSHPYRRSEIHDFAIKTINTGKLR